MRFLILFRLPVAAMLLSSGCAAAAHDSPAKGPARVELSLADVAGLARARDYFGLRERLRGAGGDPSPGALVARAVVAHAFNDLAQSNAAIHAAIATGRLSDSLVFRLRTLEATNALRLGDYRKGLEAADSGLARRPAKADSASIADLENTRRIVRALADVPAQGITRRGPTTLRLEGGRIAVTLGDSARRYIFDTGAGLSTMSRTEARSLGLPILPADIDVGSSTDQRNRADLAVAPSLTIGGLDFTNVVFLVFDDRLLTFGPVTIQGIIGFPVIAAMGEIRIRPSGVLTVPAEPPRRPVRNLALDGQTPVTTVTRAGDTLLCGLDTGANTTTFYEPFYRRYRPWIDSTGRAKTEPSGGVGGVRNLPVVVLSKLRVAVGDTTFVLPATSVVTRSIVKSEDDNWLDCRVGHDVLDAFSEYIINFRDMSFLLR